MHITLPLLARLRACADHRAAFAATFPDGLLVTGDPDPEVIAKIVGANLDVSWLCGQVLTETALAAYYKATAPALDAYKEAMANAGADDDEVTASAWSAYREATAPAAWRLLADPNNIKPEYR